MTTMKKGDFFYLCRGNSIRLLGRIDVEEALENSQKKIIGLSENILLLPNQKI